MKGCPKQKRMKGGKESGKQKRTCGFCKHVGHNISTCPEKEKEKEKENSTFSNGAKKMKNCTSIDIGLKFIPEARGGLGGALPPSPLRLHLKFPCICNCNLKGL